jgi:predicted ABC-type transport system involved in lysophospholipase L1 biosynthesis ATPase subunit
VSDSSPILVHTTELAKTYGKAADRVDALRGVQLTISRGERVALLGRSGSGKSTLLNLLGGLDRPTSGQIRVGDRNLASLSSREMARYRLTSVGMIFQAFHLVPTRTALQNVELPLLFAGAAPARRRELAAQVLHAVGLGHRLKHRPVELSGGERQRVALARALVNNPDLLLADEPTGNLDNATAGEVIDVLLSHVKERAAALLLVTHDVTLARRCALRILHMDDGRIVSEEPAGSGAPDANS